MGFVHQGPKDVVRERPTVRPTEEGRRAHLRAAEGGAPRADAPGLSPELAARIQRLDGQLRRDEALRNLPQRDARRRRDGRSDERSRLDVGRRSRDARSQRGTGEVVIDADPADTSLFPLALGSSRPRRGQGPPNTEELTEVLRELRDLARTAPDAAVAMLAQYPAFAGRLSTAVAQQLAVEDALDFL